MQFTKSEIFSNFKSLLFCCMIYSYSLQNQKLRKQRSNHLLLDFKPLLLNRTTLGWPSYFWASFFKIFGRHFLKYLGDRDNRTNHLPSDIKQVCWRISRLTQLFLGFNTICLQMTGKSQKMLLHPGQNISVVDNTLFQWLQWPSVGRQQIC